MTAKKKNPIKNSSKTFIIRILKNLKKKNHF
jgi:hypothetical protein